MAPRKKKRTDSPSDTVSWISHPSRLFGQPEECKENNKHVIPNDGLKQNDYSDKKSSQTSIVQPNIEDVVTNNGYHMFKAKKYARRGRAKAKNDTCSKMEDTHEYVPPESNGSRSECNKDQNDRAEEIKTKNYDCLEFIHNVAVKLKNKDDVFCNTIMKILDLDKMPDSRVKSLNYDLINILLSLLLDSNEDDLKFIEDALKAMIIPDHLKRFVVNKSCIQQNSICLGEGSTAVVHSGVLIKDGSRTDVALKKPKESRSNFLEKMIVNEATVLSQLDHKNIIKMLAFIKNGPDVVLELMGLGNLNEALMRVNFSGRELLKALIDISAGMEFLHGKQYLHRDLACRNVFVSVRKECKIGDFGVCVYVGDSNGVYQDTDGRGICGEPVSPESLISRTFRFQTDVWAMGMLIWNMYNLVSPDMDEFFFNIMGVPLGLDEIRWRPKRCPDDLYKFTKNHILNRNFNNRPGFSVIRQTIENYLKK